jgi:glyoxylase-like metal-dependent hydrolase (beta-lactamase superfamily II)
MNRVRVGVLLAAIGVSGLVFQAQTSAPQATHKFTQIAPGIYSAVGTGTPNVGSNSAVIVNQNDVMVVDSHISPESGRVLLKELKTLTDKPVRFLVNTHFHYDHASGNQVFGPPVEIIGHEFTRRKLTAEILQKGMFAELLAGMPKQIDDLKGRAAAEQDPAAKARLEQQLKTQQAFSQQISETIPTPPNVTLDDRLTLFRGDREIRLLYLGRGHTGGDVVVSGGDIANTELNHSEQFVVVERGKHYLTDVARDTGSGALCECDGKPVGPMATATIADNNR